VDFSVSAPPPRSDMYVGPAGSGGSGGTGVGVGVGKIAGGHGSGGAGGAGGAVNIKNSS
jgi:hypothetical protein